MTEHEIIRPVFGVLLGLGGAVLLLPAYRLTAYSADRIEFKALRYYTDLDYIPGQQNAPVVITKAFCCVPVKTEAGRRISSLQNPR